MRFMSYAAAASLAAAFTITTAQAADISGAGATFPYPIYAKWADTYKKETGIGLNYQSIGSGGGIKQIQAKTVTFGATDKPLGEKDLDDSGLIQFPMVMGGIVPVINVEGIKAGRDRSRRADARQDLPGRDRQMGRSRRSRSSTRRRSFRRHAIAVVHRSDGSGTTFNFTNYLEQGEPRRGKIKSVPTPSVEWPVGIGAKGNEGVANNVVQTKGSIGYVEYAYAKQNKLTHANMINKDGKTVAPELDVVPGGCRQCRLEVRAGLWRDPDRPSRATPRGRSRRRPSS